MDSAKRTVWRINWDNGADACGTFPWDFDTYEAAESYGNDWAAECNERDGIDPESPEAYSAEPVEVEIPGEDCEEEERCDYEGGSIRAALDSRGRP